MNVLVVTAHPRPESLTGQVAGKIVEGLAAAGHKYEILDLYTADFDPRVFPVDEPNYSDPTKPYSDETFLEMERIRNHDAIIFVFPVWWHSLPAILKGYIDRIFNYGFAYGPAKLPVEKIRWVALAGESKVSYKKRGYHFVLEHHLNTGIASYVGVPDSEVEVIYTSPDETATGEQARQAHYDRIMREAFLIGERF